MSSASDYTPNWPEPVQNKVLGFNLPPEVADAFVYSVNRRVDQKARTAVGVADTVCFDGAIGSYQFYGWAAFSWDNGVPYISDAGCDLLA
jgi:hypothetical protein